MHHHRVVLEVLGSVVDAWPPIKVSLRNKDIKVFITSSNAVKLVEVLEPFINS